MNIYKAFKENILPTPEPSSDIYDVDNNTSKNERLAKSPIPKLNKSIKEPLKLSVINDTNSNIFNNLSQQLATPPPSSPLSINKVSPHSYTLNDLPPSSPPSLSEDIEEQNTIVNNGKSTLLNELDFDGEVSEQSEEDDDYDDTPKSLFASPSRTLVLGRGDKNWKNRIDVPLSPRIDRVRHYVLPSTHTTISRTHVTIEPIKRLNAFDVRVYGKNGIAINGMKFATGSRLRISKPSTKPGLTVSTMKPNKYAKKPRYKMIMNLDKDFLVLDLHDAKFNLNWKDLNIRKAILSDCESDEEDVEDVNRTPTKRKRNITPSTPTNKPNIDYGNVAGLIAQTLALNVPTTLTPIKDIVSSMLSCNPSLEKEGSEDEWVDIVSQTLDKFVDMFGCVQRSGRVSKRKKKKSKFLTNIKIKGRIK